MVRIYISSTRRLAIIERANGACEYCLSPARWSPEIFEVERICPLGAGGKTELGNLAYACPACNRYIQDKLFEVDPATGKNVSLFNPRSEAWEAHFHWNEDLSMIVGHTAIGRATVSTLKMNRKNVQRFRQALVAVGEHPAL